MDGIISIAEGTDATHFYNECAAQLDYFISSFQNFINDFKGALDMTEGGVGGRSVNEADQLVNNVDQIIVGLKGLSISAKIIVDALQSTDKSIEEIKSDTIS